MSLGHHKCCRFVNAILAFAVRDMVSSSTPSPVVVKFSRCRKILTASNRSSQKMNADRLLPVLKKYLVFGSCKRLTVSEYPSRQMVQDLLTCCVLFLKKTMSSAYSKSETLFPGRSSTPPSNRLDRAFCRKSCMPKLKRNDLGQPCRIPLEMKGGESWP